MSTIPWLLDEPKGDMDRLIEDIEPQIVDDAATRTEYHVMEGTDPVWTVTAYAQELIRVISIKDHRQQRFLKAYMALQRQLVKSVGDFVKAEDPKPSVVYRQYGKALAQMLRADTPYTAGVREFYRDAILGSSLPLNELENPDWIDAYTGIPENYNPTLDDLIPEKREIGGDGWLALAEAILDIGELEEIEVPSDVGKSVYTSPWNRYLNERKPYSEPDKPTQVIMPGVGAFRVSVVDGKGIITDDKGNPVDDPEIRAEIGRIYNRKPTDDKAFVRANIESTGTLDDPEDYKDEDRGFVPSSLDNADLSNTPELGQLFRDANKWLEPLKSHIYSTIQKMIDARYKWDYIMTKLDNFLHQSQQFQEFLAWLNLKAHQGYAPQDLYVVFMSLQSGAILPDANEFDEGPVSSLEFFLSSISIPGPVGNLLNFHEIYGEEVLEARNDMGLRKETMTDQEIEREADRLAEEIFMNYPVSASKIEHTRLWNKHYITAVSNGSPVKNTGDPDARTETGTPADQVAWAKFRTTICPEAAEAYNKTFATTKDYKKSMAVFYTTARKFGKLKDRIIAAHQDGVEIVPVFTYVDKELGEDKTFEMVLNQPRKVNWSTLELKLRVREIDKSNADKVRDGLIKAHIGTSKVMRLLA